MKKDILLSILIALTLLSASCNAQKAPDDIVLAGAPVADGNVIAIGLMDTMRSLMQVYKMSPGTFIMQSEAGDFLLAWPQGSNAWGFLGVNGQGSALDLLKMTGNKANTMTFTDLVKWLEQNRWTYVTPTALPVWFANSIASVQAFTIAWGNMLASPIPVLLVLPGGGIQDPTYSGQN